MKEKNCENRYIQNAVISQTGIEQIRILETEVMIYDEIKRTKKAVILIDSGMEIASKKLMNLITKAIEDASYVTIYKLGRNVGGLTPSFGYEVNSEYAAIGESPIYKDAARIGNQLLSAFSMGEISEIYVSYLALRNYQDVKPALIRLLPIKNFDDILSVLINKYFNSFIFGAMLETYSCKKLQTYNNKY